MMRIASLVVLAAMLRCRRGGAQAERRYLTLERDEHAICAASGTSRCATSTTRSGSTRTATARSPGASCARATPTSPRMRCAADVSRRPASRARCASTRTCVDAHTDGAYAVLRSPARARQRARRSPSTTAVRRPRSAASRPAELRRSAARAAASCFGGEAPHAGRRRRAPGALGAVRDATCTKASGTSGSASTTSCSCCRCCCRRCSCGATARGSRRRRFARRSSTWRRSSPRSRSAHSITLSLAALGVVSLPSRWVESAIALSVVLAALNNLFPVVASGRWIAAFAFGLLHGFGFAGALQDLGLPTGSLALSLARLQPRRRAGAARDRRGVPAAGVCAARDSRPTAASCSRAARR